MLEILNYISCNAPEPFQIYFQNGSGERYIQTIKFHDLVQYYLIMIVWLVSYLFVILLTKYREKISHFYLQRYVSYKDFNHDKTIEIVWTLIPTLILILMTYPSLPILYTIDEIVNSGITVKCTGAQWYWSYEITDKAFGIQLNKSFDSYMVPTTDLSIGDFRLLEVDNTLVLPTNRVIRFIVTSKDVIHCWSVPGLGLKMDCIPGKLNMMSTSIDKPGSYYGVCQEICGIQHAYMPIKVQAIPFNEYVKYMLKAE